MSGSIDDYTPRADKAEWHLTYRCDLSCVGCNRACFLPPTTPDMTLADAHSFTRQARALNWSPKIIIIGGEPTLHVNFKNFVMLANAFTGNASRVEVWSNGHSEHARRELAWVRSSGLAAVEEGTIKPASVVQPVRDMFMAPADYGNDREPCGTHSCYIDPDCGISVDSGGYSVCCMGGMIDGVLGLGVRSKRLADLFDPDFAERQTRALCRMCGQHLGEREDAARLFGVGMSPSWEKAARKLKEGA